ncbi:MarR family transcriptional regulator [Rhodophyticola sp. CCM32]|uniref:MarR family winged helix-turn-helix transcriptional regulator n=1 Tax=Rhodophyticola sp. CCM32 TaxID=2916397 RepID=UPI00107FCED3|nr:MarR family transcriptional regulator [Rhodophyticola sp. CCM32]QBY00914.1 MarR family transcriptional regulator [Rhodophyticola sp. CCM32]
MFDYESISLHWVNRLGFLVRKELGQRFRDHGYDVTPEEWAVLLILWKHGAQTPGRIADVTFRDRTTVTRLVDGMVKKHLVERDADPKDRRKSLIGASAFGQSLQSALVPIAADLIHKAMAGISQADALTTLRCLRQMTETLLPGQHAPLPHPPDQEM